METEFVVTGYCRQLDQQRMVLCEAEGGAWAADCAYPACPYAAECPVAAALKARCPACE